MRPVRAVLSAEIGFHHLTLGFEKLVHRLEIREKRRGARLGFMVGNLRARFWCRSIRVNAVGGQSRMTVPIENFPRFRWVRPV